MALSTGWIHHIETWQRSGLKQAAYCRQQNLNYHTFSARLCDDRKVQKSSLPALIPVQVWPNSRIDEWLPLAPEHIEAIKQKLPEGATW